MGLFTRLASSIFAGFDASGAARQISPLEAQIWGTEVERALNAFSAGGGVIFPDKATADANLGYAAFTQAWVIGDATADNNGIYQKSGAAGAGSWIKRGNLPYNVIFATNGGAGTANAVQVTTLIPVASTANGQLVSVPFVAANTGAMTLSINGEAPRDLVLNVGAAVPSGYVTAGMSSLVTVDSTGNYRLFSYGDASAVQAAAEAAQAAAEDARDEAEGYAAGLNMPAIDADDARKSIVVKGDGTGFEVRGRRIHTTLWHSQSNATRTGTVAGWAPSDNAKLWNGGIDGVTGTAFESPSSIRVPVAYLNAKAKADPDTDYYLLIIGSPGVSVRATVGMEYEWTAGTSGDPGSGKIGLNDADPSAATEVRYSETDADGFTRFIGGGHLGESETYTVRIEAIGSEETVYVEFFCTSTATDHGAYRSQSTIYSESANWPPPDGTPVNIWIAAPRLKEALDVNSEAFFDALGFSGSDRVFDDIVIWPTEGDAPYYDSYEAIDHDKLLAAFSPWTDLSTQFLYTLPWPYYTASGTSIDRWHDGIRRIVASQTSARKLVDLTTTTTANWDPDDDYVHVKSGSDMLLIGKLFHKSEDRGGTIIPKYADGRYVPAFVSVANNDGFGSPRECHWWRNGDVVELRGTFQIDPTANGVLTRIGIPLPAEVPANLFLETDGWGLATSSLGTRVGRIYADGANDRLEMAITSESAAVYTVWFTAGYRLNR